MLFWHFNNFEITVTQRSKLEIYYIYSWHMYVIVDSVLIQNWSISTPSLAELDFQKVNP